MREGVVVVEQRWGRMGRMGRMTVVVDLIDRTTSKFLVRGGGALQRRR